jgi:hypothetical protein
MSLVIYVGQTILVSITNKGKKVHGVGIVTNKNIEKGKLIYDILGADTKQYQDVNSDHVHTVVIPKKDGKPILHGPACAFKLLGSLQKTFLKTNAKKLALHLTDVWDKIKSGELESEGYDSPNKSPETPEEDVKVAVV